MKESKKNLENETTQETNLEETEEKGFTAYLEIYGKSRMITKVYADFEGDATELCDEAKDDILTYLQNISGVDEESIQHAILSIVAD